jgi:hypothetical protein
MDSEEVSLYVIEGPLGQECALLFLLPGDGLVPKEVLGEIRNYEHHNGHIAIGVKFVNISDQDKQNIMEFESKLLI